MTTKILFEGLTYKQIDIPDNDLFKEIIGGQGKLKYVGYYIKNGEQYCLLPKVFVDSDDKGNISAFGSSLCEKPYLTLDREMLKNKEPNVSSVLEMLPAWFARALHFYKDRNCKTSVVKETDRNIVASTDEDDSPSLYECLSALESFYLQHRDLALTVYRESHGGYDNINWDKTIRLKQPIIGCDNQVVYWDTVTGKKTINYDEELMVLFYNTLNYIFDEYKYPISDDECLYELFGADEFRDMVDNGEVLSMLESNRNRYFSDLMTELWQKLFQFHSREEKIHNHEISQEYLLVSNFDPIFEDMVDWLISDRESELLVKKHQDDDKRIDHLFLGPSLFDPGKRIYYIGDSKYYADNKEINRHSIGKQYTYASNILKEALNIKDWKRWEDQGLFYYDKETDGFNVTPNFFIRGAYKYGSYTFEDDELQPAQDKGKFKSIEYFFEDRLFDRNTLFLLEYSVNFLYLIKHYNDNENCVGNEFKKKLYTKVREDLNTGLKDIYKFYQCKCPDDKLKEYFKDFFLGRILRFTNYDIIAIRKGDEIKDSFADIMEQCGATEIDVNEY